MEEAYCSPAGWCDLSREHREVRVRLESIIGLALKEGRYRLPVVVAPYGSGKTTLLRHLEWFARERLGVPAKLVELKELVDYIVERRGFIHESELPGVVEEFAAEVAGDVRSVLLVDEVEESYDSFSGLVEHETSPFRGLADAAINGRVRTVVVLAFGPSSAFKEALFGPVAWRSVIVGLPVIGRATVRSMLRRAGVSDEELAELLSAAVWWMSRGRVAWAGFAVEHVVPELVSALETGSLDEVLSSHLLGIEVADGVPLLDPSGLGEAFAVGAPGLVLVPGPMPRSLAERLLGGRVRLTGIVVETRAAVRLRELVSRFHDLVSMVARRMELTGSAASKATAAFARVAEAWSYRGLVPYDLESLRELVAVAADLAREVYVDEPQVARLVAAGEAALTLVDVVPLEEPLIAVRPSVLARAYPPAGAPPVFGCARSVGLSRAREVVEGLDLNTLLEASERVAEALNIGSLLSRLGLQGLLLLPVRSPEQVREALCRAVRGKLAVVLATEPPKQLEAAERLGLALAIKADERLEAFMVSALYAETVGAEDCSLREALRGSDRRSVERFGEELRAAILDRASRVRDARLQALLERVKGVAASLGLPLDDTAIVASLAGGLGGAVEALELARRVEESLRTLGVQVPGMSSHLEPLVSELERLEREAGKGLEALAELLKSCGYGRWTMEWRTPSLDLSWLPDRLARKVEQLLEGAEQLARIVSENPLAALVAAPVLSAVERLAERLAAAAAHARRVAGFLESLPQPYSAELAEAFRNSLEAAETVTGLVEAVEAWHREVEDARPVAAHLEQLTAERGRLLNEAQTLLQTLTRVPERGVVESEVAA